MNKNPKEKKIFGRFIARKKKIIWTFERRVVRLLSIGLQIYDISLSTRDVTVEV
jgi:hypothetical protein